MNVAVSNHHRWNGRVIEENVRSNGPNCCCDEPVLHIDNPEGATIAGQAMVADVK